MKKPRGSQTLTFDPASRSVSREFSRQFTRSGNYSTHEYCARLLILAIYEVFYCNANCNQMLTGGEHDIVIDTRKLVLYDLCH